MGKFKGTVVIVSIFLLAFITDTVTRFTAGSKFSDYIFGRNVTAGIHSIVRFKSINFWSGEIWRALTWPFFSKGLILFSVELIVLCLLCSSLERWLGTIKLLLTFFLLEIIVLFATLLSYRAYPNVNLEGMGIMLFALSGVMFTLVFTKGHDEGKEFETTTFCSASVVVYLSAQIVYLVFMGAETFVLLYAFSFGMCAGLVISIKNQNLFAFKISGQIKKIPPVTKPQRKEYPATLAIIAACIIIFILNSVLVDDRLLLKLYGEASFDTWLKYFLHGGDYGYVAQGLLMNTEMVRHGQIWRFVTHVFSHMGLIHMLTNMPVIYFAGKYVESRNGTFKTVVVYLSSAFTVGMVVFLEGSNTTTLGGSSLSIYALLAMFLLYSFQKGNGIRSSFHGFFYALLYFILGNIPGIGVFGGCHLISFMVGFIAIFVIRRSEGEI